MKKGQNVVFIIIAILIFVGVGIWYYTYWEANTYFSTDNSKVTAKLYTITSTVGGKLIRWGVSQGDSVEKDQILGRVENGPYLRTPIDGQVVKCDVVKDQIVAPTTQLAIIADTNNMYIGANIEENQILKIKVGQNVEVTLDSFPGKKFKGHVEEIESTTQAAFTTNSLSMNTSGTYTKVTQLIPIKIYLDDPVDLYGLIGTNAFIKIKIK